MRQRQHFRAARPVPDRAPVPDCLGQRRQPRGAHMPGLGIAADGQHHVDLRHQRHQLSAPCRRAFAARRQVAALGILAGKAEPHRHDGEFLGVVELFVADAEPASQSIAGRIGERHAGNMHLGARRLAGEQDARRRGRQQHRSRFMRQGPSKRMLDADAAGSRLGGETLQRFAHGRRTIQNRRPQAAALGRLVSAAYQRSTLAHSSGTLMRAGFMKSMAIMPVMSATE